MFQHFPIFQYVAMLTGCLNVISTGMQYGWSSVSLPELLHTNSTIQITAGEGSWIVVMLLVGAMIGAILSVILLDKLGRKYIMLASSVFLSVAWMIIAYSTSVWMLLLGRFVGGVADGAIYCATLVYLAEISNPSIRGLTNSMILFSTVFGMLLINIIGLYCNLFTTAMIAAVFPILCIVTFIWLPRSPYFLIMRDNVNEAKRSLRIFKPGEDVEMELQRLKMAVNEQTENSGKCLDLFTVPSNRRALYIMMITRGAQQFSGVTAISFYAGSLFSESDSGVLFTYGAIIYFGIQTLLVGVSSWMVDIAGRRLLLIFSLTGTAVALFILSGYFYLLKQSGTEVEQFDLIPMVAVIVFVVSCNMGLFTIPLVLVGEIFPANVKAFAVGLSDIYFSITSITATKFFQISKDSYGFYLPCLVFFVCSVIGCFLIVKFVPETKGKTLEEIQDLLKRE